MEAKAGSPEGDTYMRPSVGSLNAVQINLNLKCTLNY
jgi:hypothetical protein